MDRIELMISGEDLFPSLLSGAFILLLDQLGVVLQNIGQATWGEDIPPEVIGLDALRVGRVACTIVIALVEGQKPGVFARQTCAHHNFVIIQGEVHRTSTELEEKLTGVAVAFVLLDSILCGLFGQAVFELECGHKQAVDE